MTQVRLHVAKATQPVSHTTDSGIVSLAFHWDSRTVFSGGHDLTIRYWKFSAEESRCLEGHHDAVCCLEVTKDFLVSGDESGDIIVWKLHELSSGIIASVSFVVSFYSTNEPM